MPCFRRRARRVREGGQGENFEHEASLEMKSAIEGFGRGKCGSCRRVQTVPENRTEGAHRVREVSTVARK
jgi:hypothetical protein